MAEDKKIQGESKPDLISAFLVVFYMFIYGWMVEFSGLYSASHHGMGNINYFWAGVAILMDLTAIVLLVRNGRYFYKLISDYRFCIASGSVAAIATIVGTLILQGKPYEQYVLIYGEFGARLVSNLFLGNIFWSVWYIIIFIGFLAGLIMVPIRRKAFTKERLGFVFAHYGFATLILGAFIGYLFGYSGMVVLYPGDTKNVIELTKEKKSLKLDFSIHLNKFRVDHYDTEYKLDVYYVRKQPKHDHKGEHTEKNHKAMNSKGDIRRIVVFELKDLQKGVVKIPGSDYSLKLNKYYPHFNWKKEVKDVKDLPKNHPSPIYDRINLDWKLGSKKGKSEFFPQKAENSFQVFPHRKVALFFTTKTPPQTLIQKLLSGQIKGKHLFSIIPKGMPPFSIDAIVHGEYALGTSGYKIKIQKFLPHYAFLMEENKVKNLSKNPNNPAVKVLITSPKNKQFTVWLFAKKEWRTQEQLPEALKMLNLTYQYIPSRYGYDRYLIGDLAKKQFLEVHNGKLLKKTAFDNDYIISEVDFALSKIRFSKVRVSVQPENLSSKPKNPVIAFEMIKGKEAPRKVLLFAKPQGMHGEEQLNTVKTKDNKYIIQFRMNRMVKTYASKVTILEKGKKVREQSIIVNSPMWYRSHGIYQSSHIENQGSILNVVYDPGLELSILGMVLCVLGIPYMFYVQPYYRKRKKKKLLEDLANKKK